MHLGELLGKQWNSWAQHDFKRGGGSQKKVCACVYAYTLDEYWWEIGILSWECLSDMSWGDIYEYIFGESSWVIEMSNKMS